MNAQEARKITNTTRCENESPDRAKVSQLIEYVAKCIEASALKGLDEVVAPLAVRTPISAAERMAIFEHFRKLGYQVIEGTGNRNDVIGW